MEKVSANQICNVYRTRKYIVTQSIGFTHRGGTCFNATISTDIFYARNSKRDAEFDAFAEGFPYPDGKRIPTTMSFRKYVK